LALQYRRGLALGCALLVVATAALAQGDARKGQYVASAAGCAGCHSGTAAGDPPFGGGRLLETPFGKFYGPNITPHAKHGLGTWSEADLRRALHRGEGPAGAHYYPAFPYPSFAGMTDADVRDLWAYLRSLPAVDRPNRAHQLRFPFGWRRLVTFWKWLFFAPQPFRPDPALSVQVNRGAYLVTVLGHCGECHTPRNFLGAPRKERRLAGGRLPEGRVPNLTPTRLKRWNDAQLKEYLRSGATPEGDPAADTMYEVIRDTTSQLTASDLDALVAYLRSLPPLPDEPK
jgi:mono/diheme cytochrome c family protein